MVRMRRVSSPIVTPLCSRSLTKDVPCAAWAVIATVVPSRLITIGVQSMVETGTRHARSSIHAMEKQRSELYYNIKTHGWCL